VLPQMVSSSPGQVDAPSCSRWAAPRHKAVLAAEVRGTARVALEHAPYSSRYRSLVRAHGRADLRLGETVVPAPAGSFVLAPGGTPHSEVNSCHGPAEYLVIFSSGGLEDFFLHLSRLIESARPNQPDPDALNALAGRYGIVAV
jgi:hypothetical protein